MSIKFKQIAQCEVASVVSYLGDRQHRPITEEIWQWEFGRFSESVAAIALDDRVIIGSQAMLAIPLNLDGEVILTSKSEASFLDKTYRGKRIFESLYQYCEALCAERGHVLIWGFTSASRVWREALKFDVVEPCMYEIETGIGWKERLFNRCSRKSMSVCQYFCIDRPEKKSDMVDFYKAVRRNFDTSFHVETSDEYMTWRVYENPNLSYVTKFVYDRRLLIGYFVYSVKNKKAMIADVTYLNPQYGPIVLEIAVLSALDKGCTGLYYFGNLNNRLNKQTFSLFEKRGGVLRQSDWANFVLKRNLDCHNRRLFDSQYWYINGLWTEGFSL